MDKFKYSVCDLIELVEQRPILWDKTCTDWKNIPRKESAWTEIFQYFDKHFHTRTKGEQKKINLAITAKWRNIKDAFIRTLKKQSEQSVITKYVYHDQLSFLLKAVQKEDTDISITEPNSDENSNTEGVNIEMDTIYKLPHTTKRLLWGKRRAGISEEDNAKVKVLRKTDPSALPEEDEDLAFFMSVLPSVRKMTEGEKLEFRMGVLHLLQSKVKSSKFEYKKFIIELLEVYRGLPALWCVKSKEYTDRNKKNSQYKKLLAKYREKFPSSGKDELVKKINSLRTNFRKELKKIRDNDITKPTLWYYDAMKFLISQEQPSSSSRIITIEEEEDDNYEVEVIDEEVTRNNSLYECSLPKKYNCISTDANELIPLSCKRLQEPEKECEKITSAWAVELQQMEPQQQLFTKKAINDVLFEGQMGTLHRNSVQINMFTRSSTPLSSTTGPLTPALFQYEPSEGFILCSNTDRLEDL